MTKLFVLLLMASGVTNISYANHIDFIDDAGFFLFASSLSGPQSATQMGNPGNILCEEREVALAFIRALVSYPQV